MSMEYVVSALHRRSFFDPTAIKAPNPITASGTSVVVIKDPGSLRYRAPAVETILAWRQRIATQYRGQLGEELTWNERSRFERSEDIAESQIQLLAYAAAVLDQRGEEGLRELTRGPIPALDAMSAVLDEASHRGFGGRFPQLLLGATIWLPFEKNLMIEEPDWEGNGALYGSVPRFVDELTEIRGVISKVEPSATRAATRQDMTWHVLPGAWQTTSRILPIAALAKAKRLPLWTA